MWDCDSPLVVTIFSLVYLMITVIVVVSAGFDSNYFTVCSGVWSVQCSGTSKMRFSVGLQYILPSEDTVYQCLMFGMVNQKTCTHFITNFRIISNV